MEIISGQSVCKGIVFTRLWQKDRPLAKIKQEHITSWESEIARFENARSRAKDELTELFDKALSEVGEDNAQIFDIHKMMLDDEDYICAVKSIIKDRLINSETAVSITGENFAQMFMAMEDSYMKARAEDVKDISQRIINILLGGQKEEEPLPDDIAIAARDLAPSQTVQLDKSRIKAFVTEGGSINSHTSILARTMNVPAIIGAVGITKREFHNCPVIIDGYEGKIYINPDEQTKLAMKKRKQAEIERAKLLEQLKGINPVTRDGQKILLYANIGNTDDLLLVYKNDAQGIGLFRSEFIYLESNTFPTEDEQFLIYKSVAEKMAGKRVIIRTLDIGADKKVNYFNMPFEENPAMGLRAIRLCLKRREIFTTQLRALFRASAYGEIAIMFPMITSVDEVLEIKAICMDVKNSLKKEGIPFRANVEMGIMIETPASAIISDKLAPLVDFFSIGTNDLIQYTLASDRQNKEVFDYINPKHPAVLRLIKTIADNAHKHNKWVGICGELGSDTSLTEFFLAIGIDELSVTPAHVPEIKKIVLETDVSKIKEKALKCIE